ncbi:MAG TPA: alpha/beta hydrolase [Nocardioidaceae bacterium]|jgi:pimeloyl-ACP methyl ester carboxylesterase
MTEQMTTQSVVTPAHDDRGAGGPALLFVPGWCGDRAVFDSLVERLQHHRRVVSVDLRGHGDNERDCPDFTAADEVGELIALIERIGLDRVVPVGLSHAGWFAIELRRRLGADRVPGIVLLDWMVLGTPPGFEDALTALQGSQSWTGVRGQLLSMWSSGVDPSTGSGQAAELDRYLLAMADYGFPHWSRAGREIAAAFAAEGSPLAALDGLEPACPTLHVYAQPADEAYLAAQQGAASSRDWFQVRRLDAASHFPMFEVPDEMTRHIEDFVRQLG